MTLPGQYNLLLIVAGEILSTFIAVGTWKLQFPSHCIVDYHMPAWLLPSTIHSCGYHNVTIHLWELLPAASHPSIVSCLFPYPSIHVHLWVFVDSRLWWHFLACMPCNTTRSQSRQQVSRPYISCDTVLLWYCYGVFCPSLTLVYCDLWSHTLR